MLLKYLTVLLGLIAKPSFGKNSIPTSTIDCTLDFKSLFEFKNGRWIEDKSENKPLTVTFTDIQSNKPRIVANMGSSEVIKIEGEGVVYLTEFTARGNLVLWTWFPKHNAIILKKQYMLVETPFSMEFYGTCKDRK